MSRSCGKGNKEAVMATPIVDLEALAIIPEILAMLIRMRKVFAGRQRQIISRVVISERL